MERRATGMDNSRRNTDRKNALQTLSQTITGRSSQVLQQPLCRSAQRADISPHGNEREPSREDRDPLDMNHRCDRCDRIMPEGTPAHRKYCSTECKRAEKYDDRRANYHTFREELIKDRRCQICNGPIPKAKFVGSKFCSRKCEKSLDNPAQRLKIKKKCPHCKKQFHPIIITQVHCCHKCAGRAAALAGRNLPPRKGPPREHIDCAVCGTRFLKKERRTKYCCRACWYKSQRLLTPERFDRLLGSHKRRYRQRLTAKRFDRLMAA